MKTLIFELIKNNISRNLIIIMVINVIISLLSANTLYKFISSNNDFIKSYIYYNLLKMINTTYNFYFVKIQEDIFRQNIASDIEANIIKKIFNSNYKEFREIQNNDFEYKKNRTKYSLLMICLTIFKISFKIFSFINMLILLLFLSKISFIIVIFYIIYNFKKDNIDDKNNNEEREKLWKRYKILSTSSLTNVINNQKNEIEKELISISAKIEKIHSNQIFKISVKSYIGNITTDIMFSLLIIINYFLENINSKAFIIYIYKLGDTINIFNDIYINYYETKIYYDDLEKTLKLCYKREETIKINSFKNIIIKKLNFKYKNTDFNLKNSNDIVLKSGEIVLLDGNSGDGKSTFLDIFSGVISFKEYENEIIIDGKNYNSGFFVLDEIRSYHEQFCKVDFDASVYEIVTNKEHFENDEYFLNSLKLSLCDSFCKEYNKRFLSFSGGEKCRILLAKNLYNTLKRKSKILILDEFDKSIDINNLNKIAENIYKYCRDNNILTIVAAHTSEIKNMKYDKIIFFNKGNFNLKL